MNKKLVIVIPKKKENKVFVNSCESGNHLNGLRKFIYHYGVNINSDLLTSSKDASTALIEEGYCVMLATEYKNNKNIEIFIPREITSNQLEYFEREDIKETLDKYNIVLYKYLEEDKFEIINKSNANDNVLSVLMTELHSRKVKNNNIKKLTK